MCAKSFMHVDSTELEVPFKQHFTLFWNNTQYKILNNISEGPQEVCVEGHQYQAVGLVCAVVTLGGSKEWRWLLALSSWPLSVTGVATV